MNRNETENLYSFYFDERCTMNSEQAWFSGAEGTLSVAG